MRTFIDFDSAPVFAIPTAEGVREGVLLDGPQGWGEFSPPPGADDATAARWLTAAMEPSTVGWPDANRGRVPIAEGAARPVVTVDDVDAAAVLIAGLGGVELVELICRTPADARDVRRRVDRPVAVDIALLESDPWCADAAVVSCGPLGGVRRALRRCERLNLPAVVTFTGASSVGLAGDVALAGALPDLPFACGPVPAWIGDSDLVSSARSLIPAAGFLPVAPMPAAPDPDRLATFAVSDQVTVARWRDALHRAVALI